MFIARRFFFSKPLNCFSYGVFKSGDISMDLLLTLSMQQADKVYKNHDELVDSLVTKEILKTDLLIKSMKNLDRSFFVDNSSLSTPSNFYQDKPHSIGYGEDISAPMMQALAAETLFPVLEHIVEKEPVNFIDVGTGSGYLAMLLFDAFTKRFSEESINLNILGFDVEENLVKKTNLLFADLVEKKVLNLHSSINLSFAKRDFFDYYRNLDVVDSENQVLNIGAAIDLQTWDALKGFVSQKKGAVLSPVIQDDGEQSLMFFKSLGGKETEESLMKVMYATLKQSGQEKVNPEISKYFVEKDDEAEDYSASQINKSEDNSTQDVSEDTIIMNLKEEIESLENEVKAWTKEFRSKSNKSVSLKDMQADPKISKVLEKLNKEKKRLTIMMRAIKANS